MQTKSVIGAMIACAGLAGNAAAQDQTVIITEWYAATTQGPGQSERVQEFVEITNYGDEPVDVGDWTLLDDIQTAPIPTGTILMPGESLVMFGTANEIPDPLGVADDRASEAIFDAAWSMPARNRVFLTPFESMSNSPNAIDNEILMILDAEGDIVDEVNFDDAAPWPSDSPQSSSMSLLPEFVDPATLSLLGLSSPKEANDNGLAWRRTDLVVTSGLKMDFGSEPNAAVYVSSTDFVTVVPESDPDAVLIYPNQGNFASPGLFDFTPDVNDCNGNGVDDDIDIFAGLAVDLDQNGIPDDCGADCDNNGISDNFTIATDGARYDCDLDGVLDSCQIDADPTLDLNGNGRLDTCEPGNVIITEIMFNPAGPEHEGEWIEIYNAGTTTVNLDGWGTLKLEGGTDDFNLENVTDPAAGGVTLAPGEVAVLICDYNNPGDTVDDLVPGAELTDPVTEFELGWGLTPGSVKIIPIADWGFIANNAADPGEEILTLYAPPNLSANQPGGVAPALVLIDTVDYDADLTPFPTDPGREWPGDDGTASYYLRPGSLNSVANNRGGAWGLSLDGLNGATSTNGLSIIHDSIRTQGSPGFVQTGAETTDAGGEIVITEIMWAPNTPEIPTGIFDSMGNEVLAMPQNEFVEIHNPTAGAVDISGWYLRDEDGFSEPFPAGTVLEAGETAVIFGMDRDIEVEPGVNTVFEFATRAEAAEAFYDAWGCGYQVIPVRGWGTDIDAFGFDSNGLGQLANGPHRANEILTLRRADGSLVDVANYEDLEGNNDTGDWPNDPTGVPAAPSFSAFLIEGSIDTLSNNSGSNWFPALFGDMSQPEVRTNAVTPFFTFDDMIAMPMEASPGIIPGGTPLDLEDCPAFACSIADLNADGLLNNTDINLFVSAFLAQNASADLTGDGLYNNTDINLFVSAFLAGCN